MGTVTGPVLEPDQRPSPQWPSKCQVKGSATSLVNDPDISLVRWPTLGSDQIPVSSPIIDPVTGQSKAHYTTVQRVTHGLGQRPSSGPCRIPNRFSVNEPFKGPVEGPVSDLVICPVTGLVNVLSWAQVAGPVSCQSIAQSHVSQRSLFRPIRGLV